MSTPSTACVIANASRLNFDGAIDFSSIVRACGGDADAVEIRGEDATPSADAIAAMCVGRNILITKEVFVDVEKLPRTIEMIAEAGTGYNNIDIERARELGITVTNVPSYSSDAVAQLVITFVLASSVELCEQYGALRRGDRDGFREDFGGLPKMFELRGRSIGLVGGTGGIGSRVAELARALGMKVLVFSRSAQTCEEYEATTFDELMKRSDFISVHCPLMPSTRGLIDARAISLMKPTAKIINTARGAIINERDLIEALKAKKIAGACLDVQEVEPPASTSELYTLENVYMTPHIGWKRVETRQRLVDCVAENIHAFISGSPINVVEP